MYRKIVKAVFLTLCGLLLTKVISAQELNRSIDTIFIEPDTVVSQLDTAEIEGVKGGSGKGRSKPLDSKVEYTSEDSIVFDLDSQKIYLYKEAQVNYEDIELKANYVEFDMTSEEVFSKGMPDSVGVIQGKPIFKQGDEEFDSQTLTYNFGTKKGFIEFVITEQEDGFLHAKETKRQSTGDIHIKNGKYTTCDAEHPHFYVGLTKAIVKPNDKIVSGPAYIVIEDVPIPIGLPFGFFPNSEKRSSGILVPSYGEEVNRGFYLRDFGYYLPVNDYLDLKIMGEAYTKKTWGTNIQSTYRKRYKFSGNFNFRFYENVSGEKLLGNYSKSNDFSVVWSHRQDAKANPTRTFSANVNISSRRFDKDQSRSLDNYLTNTKSSSIALTKRWPNTPFNFSASMNHSQNSNTKQVSMNLPKASFNMSNIYPLRPKEPTGKSKWYEDITVSYSSSFDNRLITYDSLLFRKETLQDFDNGFQHNLPVSIPIKLFNTFTLRPSIGYKGWLFTKYTEKKWDSDIIRSVSGGDTTYGNFVDTTINGLKYVQSANYVPSLSLSLDKKLYGMFTSTRPDSKVQAVRHVMSPSASFSFTPGRKGKIPDYYRTAYNPDRTDSVFYSIFENEIYQPPAPSRKTGNTGSISLSLRNNLEMKLRPESDSAKEARKVKLIENFDFSSNYNIFADSLNWSDIRFNGGTRLLNQKINLRLSGTISPYVLNENNRKINKFELIENNRIGRLTNAQMSIGLSFRSQAGSDKSDKQETSGGNRDLGPVADETGYAMNDTEFGYVDFDVPWSFRMDYSWSYSKPADKSNIVQTLRFSGDLNLTPKWKIDFQSGYDFQRKEITQTSFNIHRDLHCWEMSLRIIPFGYRKSYNFKINVKSTILRDLKYEMKRDWRDYQ